MIVFGLLALKEHKHEIADIIFNSWPGEVLTNPA